MTQDNTTHPDSDPLDSEVHAEPLDGRSRKARVAKAQATDAVPPRQRRPRSSAGGFNLKLDAPQRPGFVRRFVNRDRVPRLEALGYTLVSEQAGIDSARTDGLGTRIARHAGRDDNNEAYQTYLMETPQEEFQLGAQDKEDARKPFEEAIRRSADTTGAVENAYQPGQSTIRVGS